MEIDGYGDTIRPPIFEADIKSAYPKELMPKWWRFRAKRLIRDRALETRIETFEMQRHVDFVEALRDTLRHTQIAANATLHHTYAQRPPAPRPSRMMVVYTMQDGMEYKEYVPLNGMPFYTMSPSHYVFDQPTPPISIRYEFGYTDGSPW
jgi:hypothetical protein